ncbi:unnamed protein product [Urochloa humidicola]
MAVLPPRRPRLLALAWLAVALWLAATSGCLCRHVTPPAAAGDAPPAHHVPATPWHPVHPRPICRRPFCPPRLPPIRPICPPEGCSGQGPP